MALPKINLPIYQISLPSTGETVKYRPFTVKEEKILLTAQESEDRNQITLSIKQIVNNCLVEKNIDDLAIFDIELLLITIRSKSVDNIIQFEIKEPETEELIKLELDLGLVEVNKDASHTNKIKISDVYTLFLKYPSIDDFEKIMLKDEADQSSEDSYRVMMSCLDKLASEEDVFKFKDFSSEEVDDFIESLHGDTIKEIKKFFDTMPKIRHEIPYKNSKGEEKKFIMEGTETFFI